MQSPGFVIHYETIWPVEVALAQVGPLYWEVVPGGKTFTRATGAVWFTINGQVALDGKEHISTWDAVWPVASIIGTIALGAVTALERSRARALSPRPLESFRQLPLPRSSQAGRRQRTRL